MSQKKWIPGLRYLWEHELGFLEGYGMSGVFKTLLALARSRRDIARLNGELPPHCRLPRDGEITLEAALAILYGPKGIPDRGMKKPEYTGAYWLMASQCPPEGLRGYYLELLQRDRERFPEGYNYAWHNINPSTSGFRTIARLFGVEFIISVSLPDNGDWDRMAYELLGWEEDLTEILTHNLLSRMPDFCIDVDSHSQPLRGQSFVIRLVVSDKDLEGWHVPESAQDEAVAANERPGFLSWKKVAATMRHVGIPVEDIYPQRI